MGDNKLQQSVARNIYVFMTDSTDHLAGKAGLTLTITAGKNGGAFGSISPTVNDRGNGWYELQLTTGHTDTLGDLAFHITGSGADPTDFKLEIVAYNPQAAYAYDSTVAKAAGTKGTDNIHDHVDYIDTQVYDNYVILNNLNNATVRESSGAGGGGSDSITLNPGTGQSGTDFYKGCLVINFKAGQAPQTRRIISQSGLVCYVDRNWDSQPEWGTGYIIVSEAASLLTTTTEDSVAYIRRVLGNKLRWEPLNSRFVVRNDTDTADLYYMDVTDKDGNPITLPSGAIANRGKVA